ncbi:YciI family protein [Acidisoma cellulosilytica]|uniref:YciI family protein n=1 Tax=Acidisoma cellulosilyticum TaxID=2802395 RepID=A0A964E6F8_9PROT|nr:YciI family protein [Acidisoma cellulosilyticum]MCB8882993.1 YciI family protein [Acidisoma cellulosilyticum]
MYFAIIGLDKPNMMETRLRVRPIHREYLHGDHQGVTLKLAGPLLASDGATMIGSMIIVEAPDLASAEAFSTGDPFRKEDLFSSVEIRPWDWTTGNPDR